MAWISPSPFSRGYAARTPAFVLLLTPAAVREDGFVIKELGYALANGKSVLPLMRVDCIAPIQIVNANWIDARIDYSLALAALISALKGDDSRSGKMWRIPGEPAYAPPLVYIGRAELLAELDNAVDRIKHQTGLHIVFGDRAMGKTALLREVQKRAREWKNLCILFADFSAEAAETSGDYDPTGAVIRSLWSQLLAQSEAAGAFYKNITEPERASSQMLWLRDAIEKTAAANPVLLLLDNLHLDTEFVFHEWLQRGFHRQEVLTIASYLDNAFTRPPAEEWIRYTEHYLTPLQPHELSRLFNPPDIRAGHRLFELSDGVPDVALTLVGYWLDEGLVGRSGEKLTFDGDSELPDIWETQIEDRLQAALADLNIDKSLDMDDLLDWLTCAAAEGTTFTEAGLFGVTGEDWPPEQSAALLDFLAGGPMPILKRVEPDLPLKTNFWRFTPAGLRELLLRDADARDVAYYAVKLFDVLERAAHPNPFAIKNVLLSLAWLAQDFTLIGLKAEGLPSQQVTARLQESPALERLQRYQGYAERETKIARLRLLLSVIPEDTNRWPVLRSLGEAMMGYEANAETAAVFRQARESGVLARAPGEWIAYLYSMQASVMRDEPESALELLRSGWGYLPPTIAAVTPGEPLPSGALRLLSRLEKQVVAALLDGMAEIYGATGEPEKALGLFEQALLIHQEMSDRVGEAATLNNLAAVYDQMGELAKALTLYEQALPILWAVKARDDGRKVLENLARWMALVRQSAADPGRCAEAIALMARARALLTPLDASTEVDLADKLLAEMRAICPSDGQD